MIEKIVSGGQSGVDQAALSMAMEAGLTIGGWCPKGGIDASGVCVLGTYPTLKQASTPDPNERTRLNIEYSDGTLIIVPCLPLPESIVDGTRLTIDYAVQRGKPHLVISLADKGDAIETVLHWISLHNLRVLNIGGPRESSSPGIHQASRTLFRKLFMALQSHLKLTK